MITDVATSAPVPNVDLTIRGEAGTTTVRVPNGTYVASGLQPGAYTVSVVPPAAYEVAPGTNGSVNIQVVASETKTVNFQLRRISQ